MVPGNWPLDGKPRLTRTDQLRLGLQSAVEKAYQLHGVLRINLALARKTPNVRCCSRGRVVIPDGHCGSDSQHPFGSQATDHKWPALSFAPQPCDWFAFSRMMTLQALNAEIQFALRRPGF